MTEDFVSPPRQNRMLQIIHGFPKGDALTETLDLLVERGYGGVVCNVGFDDYLRSEAEWAAFLRGIDECRQRGLRIWLYDERGYPSGKAGTVVLEGHPELETRGLVCVRTDGAGTIEHRPQTDERFDGPVVAIAGVVLGPGGAVDLAQAADLRGQADDQGATTWSTPGGAGGAVLSFHVRRMREGTHIVTNYSDDYPYTNILDARATERFIEVTHEAYAQRMGAALGECVEAMFTDEPSLMTLYLHEEPGLLPVAPWVEGLLEAFEAEHGYDLVPNLPALYGDCGDRTERVRVDFWQTVSALIEVNYYGLIQDWCRAHGIAASGHALTEEHLWWHVGFEGDLYRALRRMDVPGVDQLSSNPTELVRAGCLPIEKIASSVAHVSGATLCMSETSSHCQRVGNLPLSDDQRFGAIAFQYAMGVNQITSYYSLNEMAPERMAEFNDYIGRLGALLTGGVHVAPVAVYYPIHTGWAGYEATDRIAYQPCPGELARRAGEQLASVSRGLLWNQVDFDYLDDQAIVEGEIGPRRLTVGAEAFRVVVLAGAELIPVSTYERLAAFVDAGGVLLVCGELPRAASTDGTDEEVRALSRRLQSHVRVEVLEGADGLADVLGYFLPRDLAVSPAARDIVYTHRILNGQHVYFVANCGDEDWAGEVTLSLRGEPRLLWPRSGRVEPLVCGHGVCGTTFPLTLRASESVAVVYEPGAHNVVDEDAEAVGCCAGTFGHCGQCCAGETAE